MDSKIMFAVQKDKKELREIFQYYGMDLSGEIQGHVVIKENGRILAGLKIIEFQPGCFYLVVLCVREGDRSCGLGGFFLERIIENPRKYCSNLFPGSTSKVSFSITTIARGGASGFYSKYGFLPADFTVVPEAYQSQCEYCPWREGCNPIPMVYKKERDGLPEKC
ncbi:MAG: N-acetyltransferase [Bacillota bacterium]